MIETWRRYVRAFPGADGKLAYDVLVYEPPWGHVAWHDDRWVYVRTIKVSRDRAERVFEREEHESLA